MMICPNCGGQNPDGVMNCQRCGAPLGAVQQPVQQPYRQPVQQPYQQPVQQPYQQPVQQPYQQPMQQPYQQPYQQPMQQPYQQPFQPPRKRFPIARIIIIVLIIAILFVLARRFLGGSKKNNMHSGTNSGVENSLLDLGAASGTLDTEDGDTVIVRV